MLRPTASDRGLDPSQSHPIFAGLHPAESVREPATRRTKPMSDRAGDRTRTDDNHVGNVVLYQLSYTRKQIQPPKLSAFRPSEVNPASDDSSSSPNRAAGAVLVPIRTKGPIIGGRSGVARGSLARTALRPLRTKGCDRLGPSYSEFLRPSFLPVPGSLLDLGYRANPFCLPAPPAARN